MRLRLRLSPSHGFVPFDYQHELTRAFWRWVKDGKEHDETSLYSLSFLSGGRPTRTREGTPVLDFSDGATWTISGPYPDLHRRLLRGVMDDPLAGWGMRVEEVHEQPLPEFGVLQRFRVNGAVLVREKRDDGSQEHLRWDDPQADEALTRVFRWKLHLAGRDDLAETAEMRFDRTYDGARTKLVTLKGLKYRCNECPVLVLGEPEAVLFAYLVGAGELTGSCLGALTL
ncbi:MAG: CRISPR-associated protein Cas6 [Rhodothermales bacterium]|nr:CRISPR-associated protein Cas6 [Rhodothermales bacterium]